MGHDDAISAQNNLIKDRTTMELRVLTLNCWGLYLEAKNVKDRFKHIAEEVEHYDIVCLQEIWSRDDYCDFVHRLSTSLQHSHHFINSSFLGSGLCVFSRYPIVSVITHQFRVTGGIRIFHDGEIFAGKGVLCCKIEAPQGIVSVFNTHINPRCRESQIFELMQLIRHIRGNDAVIVCGDFNTKSTHASYRLMTDCLGLCDVYSNEPDVMTCDIATNIYTKTIFKPNKSKRIDFVFHSGGLSLISRKLSMSGLIPGKSYPYSDHEGVEAIFSFQSYNKGDDRIMTNNALQTLDVVSHQIKQKMNYHFKNRSSLKQGILLIIGLVLSGIFVSLLLSTFLHSYQEFPFHWVILPIAISFGSIIALFFIFMLNENHIYSGFLSNIHEINAILDYHKFQKNRRLIIK